MQKDHPKNKHCSFFVFYIKEDMQKNTNEDMSPQYKYRHNCRDAILVMLLGASHPKGAGGAFFCMCESNSEAHAPLSERRRASGSHLHTIEVQCTAMDLIFFGIQGSGKGTQAKKLAYERNYDIFEAGGELRKIAASGTELGKTVKSYIDVGKLVPHEIIMNVVEDSISKRNPDQKILFDGIPRDLDQMRDFNSIMEKLGRSFCCIHITLSEEDAIQRILKRAETEGRADDASEDTIRKRMDTFLNKTMLVIKEYEKQKKVYEVDGHGTIDNIYGRIIDACDRIAEIT